MSGIAAAAPVTLDTEWELLAMRCLLCGQRELAMNEAQITAWAEAHRGHRQELVYEMMASAPAEMAGMVCDMQFAVEVK